MALSFARYSELLVENRTICIPHLGDPLGISRICLLLIKLECLGYRVVKQEAQLSQRDRAMLRVIEYFAKSFKGTQGHLK